MLSSHKTILIHAKNHRNIIPFIKKYKRNPVTWAPLKASDLIKLNFHKNEKGEYWDPVASKTFTDHTHIVAIATSGNVYCAETIEELNRKPKFWRDLMTGSLLRLIQ